MNRMELRIRVDEPHSRCGEPKYEIFVSLERSDEEIIEITRDWLQDIRISKSLE